MEVVDRTQAVWELSAASERPRPSDFLLDAASPARNAGIVIPPHALFGFLPDTRNSRDIGAIPYGTPASEYAGFPFDPTVPSGAPLVDVEPGPAPGSLALRVIPHPVSRGSRLTFTLPREGPARLELLDLQGRVVRKLLNAERLAAGEHTIRFDPATGGARLSAGLYFYRLISGASKTGGRLVLID
jgi:hypothetical protein